MQLTEKEIIKRCNKDLNEKQWYSDIEKDREMMITHTETLNFKERPYHIDNGVSILHSGVEYMWWVHIQNEKIWYLVRQTIFSNGKQRITLNLMY